MDADRIIDEAAAGILPFESWERLDGESGAAFRAFRDFGPERNMRKAAICYANRSEFDSSLDVGTEQRQGLKPPNSTQAIEKRYRMWRNWAVRFQWAKRAADYDGYLDKLKQAELHKTIEAQGEKHREATGKMLSVVIKKLVQTAQQRFKPVRFVEGNRRLVESGRRVFLVVWPGLCRGRSE